MLRTLLELSSAFTYVRRGYFSVVKIIHKFILTINILTAQTKLLLPTSSHPGFSSEEAIRSWGSFLTFLYGISL